MSLAAFSLGVELKPIFIAAVPDVYTYHSRFVSSRAEVDPKRENLGICLFEDAWPMSQCAADNQERHCYFLPHKHQ